MQTHVVLLNWTDQGIREYKNTVDRASVAIETLVRSAGGRMKELFWTIGPHDLVALLSVPDEETLAALLLQVEAAGNVRAVSMRAFNAGEMQKIINTTRWVERRAHLPHRPVRTISRLRARNAGIRARNAGIRARKESPRRPWIAG